MSAPQAVPSFHDPPRAGISPRPGRARHAWFGAVGGLVEGVVVGAPTGLPPGFGRAAWVLTAGGAGAILGVLCGVIGWTLGRWFHSRWSYDHALGGCLLGCIIGPIYGGIGWGKVGVLFGLVLGFPLGGAAGVLGGGLEWLVSNPWFLPEVVAGVGGGLTGALLGQLFPHQQDGEVNLLLPLLCAYGGALLGVAGAVVTGKEEETLNRTMGMTALGAIGGAMTGFLALSIWLTARSHTSWMKDRRWVVTGACVGALIGVATGAAVGTMLRSLRRRGQI
jgi:hypothetical protein